MKVFKFGGASICDANAVRNMKDIINGLAVEPLLVVVSAMGKGTNALENLLVERKKYGEYQQAITNFTEFHFEICEDLFKSSEHPVFTLLEKLSNELLRTVTEQYSSEEKMYDQVISYGELFSTTIVNAFLLLSGINCKHIDSRDLIITDSTFREGKVKWDLTRKAIRKEIDVNFEGCYLTQGFIAANQYGDTLTLGREGSDFTAAIYASCLDAQSVTIWKDVPGILNADPNLWEHTLKYDSISYGEAAEMTYYGAKVIHPKTIRPLAIKKIPLYVKSFKHPHSEGTQIHDIKHEKLAPSIIFKPNQCLISFQVRDFTFINEAKLSIIFHLIEKINIRVNMMQSSAISFSVCVDRPDKQMKSLLNSLNKDFEIHYNDHLELVTVKNYQPNLVSEIREGKNILLEQKTRKNYQMLITS